MLRMATFDIRKSKGNCGTPPLSNVVIAHFILNLFHVHTYHYVINLTILSLQHPSF